MLARKDEKEYISSEIYFALTRDWERRTELHEGEIVDLASPTATHNDIAGGLYSEFKSFIKKNSGKCSVKLLNFDIDLGNDTVVVPDVAIICDRSKLSDKRCTGAPDLIVEIVSTNRNDDYVKKLFYYEKAGVKEYWIVDIKYKRITVYKFGNEESPTIYGFDEFIPVGIWDNKLTVCINDFIEIYDD
ncbi:MAG: Uma2 family endonuclease [Oscillospiraceae bacterium]|nr:Uma2 family endonuclease [Oscillospiraceae bacterium]